MKSSESKVSSTSSNLQAKSKHAFFGPEKGEAFSSDKASSHAVQTKTGGTPFFNANGIQAKLEVHPSDDVFEKEADSMADQVMQKSGSSGDAPPKPNENNSLSPLSNSISRVQRQRA